MALTVFSFLGRADVAADPAVFDALERELATEYQLGPVTLLPLALLLYLSIRRYPPLPVVGLGALAGVAVALLLQFDAAVALAPEGMTGWPAALAGAWVALFDGYRTGSELPQMTALLDRGGMSSMLNTIWLILCAMVFGGVMERAGLLQRLVAGLLALPAGLVRALPAGSTSAPTPSAGCIRSTCRGPSRTAARSRRCSFPGTPAAPT